MTRLIVVVEGQTEEAFVNDVLAPHLLGHEVYASATIVGKAMAHRRRRVGRGGGHFARWKRDLEQILGHDRNVRVTTLFDLYGLPRDFPGFDQHCATTDTNQRCDALEAALSALFADPRLLPYLQRHEFEALVLASLESLAQLLDAPDDLDGIAQLETEIRGLSPEDINDGERTAPSKRLLQHIPGYTKTLHGPLAVADTGLVALRKHRPRFDAWVSRLESL